MNSRGKSTNASFSQPMGVCVEIWSRTTVQMNMLKFIYMSFGERSKDMIGHRSYRPRGKDFQVGGLTRTRKREPTRGVRGHVPPGKFEILFF